jgi:hypothetical protein
MGRSVKKGVAAFLAAAALCGLNACASGARSANMTTSTAMLAAVAPGEPGYKAFRVGSVSGGSDTNPLWMSNVSTAEFKTALENSLRSAGHLADDSAAAAYEISAQMLGLDRPAAGLAFSVESSVRYKAQPVNGGAALVDDQIQAVGTAKFGDHLVGVERLRIANEKSAKTNIEQFIATLRARLGGTAAEAKPIS